MLAERAHSESARSMRAVEVEPRLPSKREMVGPVATGYSIDMAVDRSGMPVGAERISS